MIPLFTLLQAAAEWRLFWLYQEHPYLTVIALVFVLRWFVRWFFGVSRLRHAQNRYAELLERHNAMLEEQNRLLRQHEGVLGRLGEKYLS